MPNPNISEILTTTMEYRAPKIRDNVSRTNAILSRLREKDRDRAKGGAEIREPLDYAQNGTFGWYSGYEKLDVAPQDVLTSATYSWRQASGAVTISGLEQMQNSGKEALKDLLESRMVNLERTMKNGIAKAMYSDGSNAKELHGLRFLIATDPTAGTVGGINRATWHFWRNIKFAAVADGNTAANSSMPGTAGSILSYMNRVYVQLVDGVDGPDLIMADNNYYRLYMETLQPIQRLTDPKMASSGFTSLKFMNADVVLDGGIQSYGTDPNMAAANPLASAGGAPTDRMYFLNTDYLAYRPHTDRNMVVVGGERQAVDQDAIVKVMLFGGNLTMSNARKQGVLLA